MQRILCSGMNDSKWKSLRGQNYDGNSRPSKVNPHLNRETLFKVSEGFWNANSIMIRHLPPHTGPTKILYSSYMPLKSSCFGGWPIWSKKKPKNHLRMKFFQRFEKKPIYFLVLKAAVALFSLLLSAIIDKWLRILSESKQVEFSID